MAAAISFHFSRAGTSLPVSRAARKTFRLSASALSLISGRS